MASIGKLALNMLGVSNEAAVALAQLNFDFSLVKMDAPAEFQQLGHSLSHRRKLEAEDGTIHSIARKLGALFADDMPPIPHLTRAYGLRASEISANTDVNPPGGPAHGPMSKYIGADGTSIWAAATSGKGALEVHLLACMLARIWSAAEAITIWVEVLTARKNVLLARTMGTEFSISAMAASRIEVSRNELALWDASARSWLETADAAKMLQQKQLLLIIDNLGLKLASRPQIYDAVFPAWINSMKAMEAIMVGMPQKIQSAEVLLGLSSWHLYPDMHIALAKEDFVQQNDHLVPKEGLITLGLQDTQFPEAGVTWSLPLSHLRFYGSAITRRRTLGSNRLRMSMNDVLDVALGASMSAWPITESNMVDMLSFAATLARSLSSTYWTAQSQPWHWIQLFEMKFYDYENAKDFEQQAIVKRMALGHRRHGRIFGPEHPLPSFGLCHPRNLLSLFSSLGNTKDSIVQQLIHLTKMDPLTISKFRDWKEEETASQLLSMATIRAVLALFKPDRARLLHYLNTFTNPDVPYFTVSSPYADGMNNLLRAFWVYQELPIATIDISILEHGSLWDAGWGVQGSKILDAAACRFMTRPQKFSCITAFESGNFLSATDFSDVVAVSSGNSLFVTELLLSDPASKTATNNVRHLLGNIGEPGVSLLLLADMPEAAKISPESWELVNHADFDGCCDDSFGATSVHLNLTGDKVPLNIGMQGACDKAVSYVEAVVSVHDHGTWTTDFSVLHRKFFTAQPLLMFVGDTSDQLWLCKHSEEERDNDWKRRKYVSIDCWAEFFDAPMAVGVIRSRGNWLTRLAMASRIIQQGHHVVLCSSAVICWACVDVALSHMSEEGDEETRTFILL